MPGDSNSWWARWFGGDDERPTEGATRSAAPASPPGGERNERPPRRIRRPSAAKRRLRPPPRRLAAPDATRRMTRASLIGIDSWAYQLQDIRIADIAACEADLCVVDSTPNGVQELAFTRDQVERMQGRRGGYRKKVLCYLSIGEAEEHRFYWNDDWVRNGAPVRDAPAWLSQANREGWAGNYKVRYWDPDWQQIVFARPDSFLNRIIDAGFDGAYLDIVDGYEYWQDEARGADRRETAAADMVGLVGRIAEHAWNTRGHSGFLIVPQNGEGLLEHDRYRASISGLAKEDVLFAMDGSADDRPGLRRRAPEEVEDIAKFLRLAQADRLPVLGVEYLADPPEEAGLQRDAIGQMVRIGLVPHLACRNLNRLSPVLKPVAAGV